MKLSGAIAMSLACALAGFFGGRLSQEPAAADASAARGQGLAAGRDGTAAGQESGGPRAGGKSSARHREGKNQGPLSDSLRDIVESWKNQNVTMQDGGEMELLLFDLAKFSHIMSSLEKTTEADIAELKEMVKADEHPQDDAEILEALVTLPLLGRDIQLRGGRALDAEIDRALEDPLDTEVEEMLPIMLYSLALQNPAEAEAWLESYSNREDLEDLLIDREELQAAIEKASQAKASR